MDLSVEASSEKRVLIARHISAEKALPESNNAINSTLLCHKYSNNPDFESYYSAVHPYIWILWCCGLVIVIALWILYFITLQSAKRHWREYIRYVVVVLSVYPIVATGAFITIVLPRFRLPAEAISQQIVTVALYNLFSFVIAECGGVDQLVRRSDGSNLETRVPPCCCWPCCVIPRPKITKKCLTSLHYLVLQMPIIQAIIYVLLLALWAEDYGLYSRNFVYFQPFVAASILPAMWGVIMCVRNAISLGYNPKTRFLAVQIVLILVKLQVGLAKSLGDMIYGPCLVMLHPSVFASLIQNCMMLVEMLLLSIWAWRIYRAPPQKSLNTLQKEKSISTPDVNIRAIEVRSIKDGIDNKSFNNNVHLDE